MSVRFPLKSHHKILRMRRGHEEISVGAVRTAGDLRSLINEQRALTGETHARIRIVCRNVIGVFVRHG